MKLQKDIVNRFNREKKYRLSVFSMSPNFDWKILLAVVLISLILITGFGFQIYRTILKANDFNIEGGSVLNRQINKEKLDQTIERFSEKKSNFQKIFIEEDLGADSI